MYTEYDENDYNYSSPSVRRPAPKVRRVKKVKKPITARQKRTYIIIAVVIGISVIIGLTSLNKYYNSYEYFESMMVENAENYIKSNNMTIRDKIFLDIKRIGMEPKEGCSLLSGVIVDNQGNYKPYLTCEEYTSPIIENDSTAVKLKGHEVTVIPKGITYVDAGVSFGKYTVIGKVGTEEGVYDLVYNVTLNGRNHTLRRMVIVTDNSYVRTLYPTITLTGNKVEYTIRGYDYVDKGATATDNVDGNLVGKISGSHNIDPNVAGEYEYVYMVTNSRGYTNTVKRKVVVVENYTSTVLTATVTPESMTNKDVTLSLSIFGNNFKSIYLPDQTERNTKNVEYRVTENGDYTFLAIDYDGKSISKTIRIDNIDKTPPSGTCFAQVYPQYVDIQVNLTSNKQISGFNYTVDGQQSGFINSTTYRMVKTNAKTASVQIKDTIGNTSTSKCTVKLMDPTIGNNKVKYYTYNGVEYVIPNTRNDLTTFQQATCRKISQSANPDECGSSCLSFSLYHSAYIQYGNLSTMNENAACHYNYGHLARVDTRSNATKADALKMVYDEILKGGAPVLQVTGTKARNSRHFVLVVGYKRSKYYAKDLVEEDLLVIDSWTGCFSSLSYSDTSKRTMYDNKDGKGYRVDLMIGK